MAAHHQSARVWWSRASRQRSLNRAGVVTRAADHTERPSRTRVTIMDVAVIIGTSGWQYRDWKGRFYPAKLPQRLWLEHYAATCPTVEVNNAFYRLPEKSVFEQWRARTPDGFVVAVKVSRYLTHIKRLADPAEPVSRFVHRAAGLGDRLGPCLLQLPPTLQASAAALDETLREFPPDWRVAVEP